MRSFRPKKAGRRFRRPKMFDALAFRIGAVFVAASCPLIVLLGFWAPTQRGYTLVAFATMLGIFIAVAGLDLLVASPLRRLGGGIDLWRSGNEFEPKAIGHLPHEFRSVALSFRKATMQLSRREAELTKAVQRQDLAMQEIHHRVKNNLQVVASLLNLQASRIRLPEAKFEFQAARDRVRALATVHRHLYAHGEINTINMRVFLTDLCGPLLRAMGQTGDERVKLVIDAPELQMTSDQAVPLSLIVTEAVTNALKYGFPNDRPGTIEITLTCEDNDVTLDIRDDGVGIPAGRVETDAGTRDGIGLQLIRGFARQLGATLTMNNPEGEQEGTRYLLKMKLRHERIELPALEGDRRR